MRNISKLEEPPKKGSRQIPLTQLWEQVPEADRREIGRILAGMMAAQILPSHEKEESHEQSRARWKPPSVNRNGCILVRSSFRTIIVPARRSFTCDSRDASGSGEHGIDRAAICPGRCAVELGWSGTWWR